MPSFEIPADNFTCLSVFDSPKGSSNTFKTHKNISLYFKRRYLVKFTVFQNAIIPTLKKDQPLRLLLNLLFYHLNHSEPTHKSQFTKLIDVIAACNQLNVNALS